MFRQLLTLLMIILTVLLVSSDVALAYNTDPQPGVNDAQETVDNVSATAIVVQGNFSGKIGQCLHFPPPGIAVTQEEWNKKYTARFSYCMRDMLGDATKYILNALHNYMQAGMYAIMLLAAVIMGVKAIGGMFRNVKVESALFVMKIMWVIMLFDNMDTVADLVYDATDWILVLLAKSAHSVFAASPQGAGFSCNAAASATDYGAYNWIRIYDWVDCLIQKLIGIGTDDEVKAGFVAVAGASLFTGTTGVQLSIMFMSLLWALGMFMMRAATILVMAYGALSLLMLMLPIFLLTVFFKVTENYFFERWLGLITSNVVQPAILMAFMYFAIFSLDILIYKGSDGFYYTHGPAPVSTTTANGSTSYSIENVEPTTGIVSYTTFIDAGVGQPPPSAAYEEVVEPLHKVIGVDINATPGQQATQLARIVKEGEKLFDFKIDVDGAFFSYLDKNCGELGKMMGGASRDEVSQMVRDNWDDFKDKFADPDAAIDAITDQQSMDEATARKMKFIFCGGTKLLRGALRFDYFRNKAEEYIQSFIPSVPRLDFSTVFTPKPGEDPANVHEKHMGKFITAIAAILVLSSTLFTYTKHIQSMAQTLTKKMGTSLSFNSPSIGGETLNNRIKTGLNSAEDNWNKALKNPNASTFDKVAAPVTGLVEGVRKPK